MGRKAREERDRLNELHKQGYQKRLEYSARGKAKAEESQATITQKEAELEVVRKEVEELAAAKDAAEEPERAAKEEHQQRWEEEKAVKAEADRRANAQFGFDELDTNSDGFVSVDELRTRYELDDDEDGDISEEEALSYLNSLQSVDFDTFYSSVWESIADKCQFERPTQPPQLIEPPYAPPEDRGEPNEQEDNDDDYDYDDEDEDEDEEEHVDSGGSMPEYDDATKQLVAIADEARNAHHEADGRKMSIEREINDLKKYLQISYGIEHEFSPLYDQCYEFTDREYTYKMCSFSKVTQRPKNGGRETNLGNWGKWNGPSDDLYSVMLYEDGEKCWNGPSRSATVTLVCGMEERLMSASEPNRCEYAMEFSTPAVCDESPKHAAPAHGEL
jgi:protein kinase C substrate 80K-H